MATSTISELLDYVFDGKRPALYAEMDAWLRTSRRFKAFADTYRTKIHNKVRNARDEGGSRDLAAELEAAYVLLDNERFTVAYETYAASGRRGPDFTVTFKTHTPFNIEVRRIRRVELSETEPDAHMTKLMAVLCEKMGQMPPSIVNLLWLTAAQEIPEAELTRAIATLRQLAEQKTDDYFVRRGYRNSAEFLKAFRHLGGIVVHGAAGNALWLNPLARHMVPPEIASALRHLPRWS